MTFNEWFCSLPMQRQTYLRGDKWMLAYVAFAAGEKSAQDKLVECQAREEKLCEVLGRVYSTHDSHTDDGLLAAREAVALLNTLKDHTALNEAIKQARREALLGAAEVFGILGGATCEQLRHMAGEIK